MIKKPPYINASKISKPKNTKGGEFIIKSTGEDYKGKYFKTYGEKYQAGSTPEDGGEELQQIPGRLNMNTAFAVGAGLGLGLLLGLAKGLFKPKISNKNKIDGTVPRFFAQDDRTSKVIEVDKEGYDKLQKQPGVTTTKIDWVIKQPAEDKVINGYPLEGSISKNKKLIDNLETKMKGIKLLVKDYNYLLEEPLPVSEQETVIYVVPDVEDNVTLTDSRKASFDTRENRTAPPLGFHYMPDGTLMADSEMVDNPSMKNSQMSNNNNN
jgi:hypothetical protein